MKLSELISILDGYIVGGAVRDLYMHRTPHDYDIITTLTPSEIRERVDIAYAIGEKFGTLCVATSDAGVVEVTTARSDITGGRHPSVVYTTDIMKDLERRDFTMNALTMDSDGIIGGISQGLSDIDDKIIRCVGDAETRLAEDPLLALRAIRFSIQLHFDFDMELEYTLQNFDLQIGTQLAGTRVTDELAKMFAIDASMAIDMLSEYGLLAQIFPEVEALHFCCENLQWHPGEGNTFQHTLNALKRAQKYSFGVQMAVLMHDIGKGAVRNGNSTKYYGHAHAGRLMIPAIAERLLWSNALKESCEFVCENHMKMHVIEEMRPFKRRELYSNLNFEILYQAHVCDSGDRIKDGHYSWIINDATKLLQAGPLITGHDIVAHGIIGPRVGELKELCHDAQLRGEFETHAEGVEYLQSLLESD